MLELKTTQDPYAVEIWRDGKGIGVIRFHSGNWRVSFDKETAFYIEWDVIDLIQGFKAERSKTLATA